jgi:hypothetical protein
MFTCCGAQKQKIRELFELYRSLSQKLLHKQISTGHPKRIGGGLFLPYGV